VDDLRRGDLLTIPGAIRTTDRLDVRLTLTADAPVELEQNDEVDFFLGADELPVRVTLLDTNRLRPGETGWVQLRLSRPVPALKGDRFIVRRPSPSITIGGGAIVDPAPRRHKRFQATTLDKLATLAAGTPEELLIQALADGPLDLKATGERANLDPDTLREAISAALDAGTIVMLTGDPAAPRPADVLIATSAWAELQSRMRDILAAHHRAFPLRAGMSKEEFRSRLGLAPRLHDAAIAAALRAGTLAEEGPLFRLPDHRITFKPAQRAIVDPFLAALAAQPYSPPAPADLGVTPDLLAALVETNAVRRIDDSVVFAPAAYDDILATTLAILDAEGAITVARFRDRFNTSRKYALAALEHFDRLNITRRVGDERVRGSGRM
jgi:selenocysteine-specific elongation factor